MSDETKTEKTEQEAASAELPEQELDQVAGGTVVIEIAGRPVSGQGE